MILLNQMKNLKIYQRPMFLPTLDDNKKLHSAIMLLTPNYDSTVKMVNNQMTINRLRFQSYYMEKDLSYYINGKTSKSISSDDYVNEQSAYELYQSSENMDYVKKYRLENFGLPLSKRFPLDTEEQIESAVKYFNYVSKFDEAILAESINKRLVEEQMSVYVSDDNRFKKYYNGNISNETTIDQMVVNSMVESLGSFILFSGFATDTDIMSKIFTPELYYTMLKEMRLEVEDITDIPVLSFTIIDDKNSELEYDFSEIDGHLKIDIEIHPYDFNDDLDVYIFDLVRYAYIAILNGKFPNIRDSKIANIMADECVGADSDYCSYAIYLFDEYCASYASFYDMCNSSDPFHCDIMKELYSHFNLTPKDFHNDYDYYMHEAKEPITIENIVKKFKYLSTTKYKKEISEKNNVFKRYTHKLEEKFKNIKPTEIHPNFPVVESYMNDDLVSEEFNDNEYINFGNGLYTFFDESASTSNGQLRRLLYDERIKRRAEILLRLKQAKIDMPDIKYAYPDIEKYQSKNVFMDLHYYNEVFFKNNVWANKKGFDLYLDLLDRLINDPRIKENGYTNRVLFIPILDWAQNKDTKMWLYRNSINPISIIFELMRTSNPRLIEIFKDIPIVFFANGSYFKMDFKEIDDVRKAWLKFSTFITRIISHAEFDQDDIDSSFDNFETKEVIKANLSDAIEIAKGVDIIGKDKPYIKVAKELDNKVNGKRGKFTPKKYIDPLSTTMKGIVPAAIIATSDSEKESPVTNTADQEAIKNREADIMQLSLSVNDIASSASSTDAALDIIDNDKKIKQLIDSIDSIKADSVKIDGARAARMNDLDKKFLDKSVGNRSIRDILAPPEKNAKNSIPVTKLKIASPNAEWKNLTYMNFDKNYDLEKDIYGCFYHFTKVSKPYAIRDLVSVDNSTSEDRVDLYTASLEDYRGTRFTLKLDIPKPLNNRFLLRGNEKTIENQFFNMPILKTDLDTCQIISNYRKIFVYRYNNTAGKSFPNSGRLLKALSKYAGKNIKVTYGDNSKICNKYQLPIDYIDLAGVLNTIEDDRIIIYFNQEEIRKLYTIDDSNGVPYAYVKNDKSVLYYKMQEYSSTFIDTVVNSLMSDSEFMAQFKSAKPLNSGVYSRCKIMSTFIPLVLICAYTEGLTKTLQKANIHYTISETVPDMVKDTPYRYDKIKFSDGALYYEIGYESCMLLNGLKAMDTEDYSIADIDSKAMYVENLDDFGGRIKADGIDNFYDCLVDPITYENLEYYKLPTDFVSILLYANMLLSDNKFIKHTDSSSRRIRRTELVAAYAYEALSEAYGTYANQLKHNKSGATFVVKQSAVIDKFLASPISSDDSVINALSDVETTNSISYKGKAGLNSARAYSLDKRVFDDSMLNVLAMSTGFSANAGISRQSTIDMNIETTRGYVKDIDSNMSEFNAAKTLCASEAVTPFGSTRDDAARTSMTFAQTTKHMVCTEKSDPLLVSNGSDQALPYMTTDKFAFKAKHKGVISDVSDEYVIIKYSNGTSDYINTKETVEKNSNGGYYIPLKIDLADGLKVGSKVEENQIVAYDKKSFSNNIGESDNIAYNVGKLCKVAIINTDDGYEDSGVCTESLTKDLATKVIKKMDKIIDKDANIFKYAKIGDVVKVNDPLIIWQDPHDEEEANALIKILGSKEEVNTLGRKTLLSETSGVVVDIKIFRTTELSDMSDSLREMVAEYERPINKLKTILNNNHIDSSTLSATYKLSATGKLKKAEESILIEYYVEFLDTIAVGDKITYFAANKAIIRNIIRDDEAPFTDFRPKEKIAAFASTTSIEKRMIGSVIILGSLQKLMVELDRSIKDMLNIPYDDSRV